MQRLTATVAVAITFAVATTVAATVATTVTATVATTVAVDVAGGVQSLGNLRLAGARGIEPHRAACASGLLGARNRQIIWARLRSACCAVRARAAHTRARQPRGGEAAIGHSHARPSATRRRQIQNSLLLLRNAAAAAAL